MSEPGRLCWSSWTNWTDLEDSDHAIAQSTLADMERMKADLSLELKIGFEGLFPLVELSRTRWRHAEPAEVLFLTAAAFIIAPRERNPRNQKLQQDAFTQS